MSFLRKIRNLINRESSVVTGIRTGATPLLPYGGGGCALAVATVYRCVKLLSESVATLPVQYMRLRDGIFVEASSHNLNYLLNVQPSEGHNAFDFWAQAVTAILMDGNAYAVPFYEQGELSRIVLCATGTVQHDTLNDVYYISDADNGVFGRFEENEVVHFRGFSAPGKKSGVSVLTHARLALNIAKSGDRETLNRFENGGNVRGLLSNGVSTRGYGEYQDSQLKKLATVIDSLFRGGGRIVALPGQLAFQQLSMSSADMQFLESRKFSVREICRFFGVHPSFVFDDTSNNYKSAEQANMAFLSHTLSPLLRNIEIELLRKLVAPSLAHRYKFTFDRRGLYACDLSGLMSYRAKMLQMGATVNELRRLDNMPPVAGGDVPMVSANLRTVAEASASSVTDHNQIETNTDEGE